MAENKDFDQLLEKIYIKLETLHSFEEADLFEIKNNLRDVRSSINFSQTDDKIDKLSFQLENFQKVNQKIADAISNFTGPISVDGLQSFKIEENSHSGEELPVADVVQYFSLIKEDLQDIKNGVVGLQGDSFKNLAEAIISFENKLSQLSVGSESDLNENSLENVSDKSFELKEKLIQISSHSNECKEVVLNEIAETVREIKVSSANINNHLENIANLQNLALTGVEFEDKQRDLERVQKEYLDSIKSELVEIQENLCEKTSSVLAKFETEDIPAIKSALDENAYNLKIEIMALKDHNIQLQQSIWEDTEASIKEIKEKFDNIANEISQLGAKVDIVGEKTEDDEELENKIDVIYDNISVLNDWARKLDDVKLNVVSLGEKIEESSEKTEEEEELENKIDIIYENISLLNGWVSKIDDTKAKIEELSNEFALVTSATKDDTENYIYTLLDIEADFAKLHTVLNESTNTSVEEIGEIKSQFDLINEALLSLTNISEQDLQNIKAQFDILNDDISSISKRTNKLILTSDDANKVFYNHLKNFETIIAALDNKVVEFNPVKQLSLLESKINTVKKLAASNLTSSQSLNEAFVFLAEWVDATGETINSIKDSMSGLQAQLENVQLQNIELQNDSPKPMINQLKVQVAEVVEKFESLSSETAEHFESFTNVLVEEIRSSKNAQTSAIDSLNSNFGEKLVKLEEKVDIIEQKFASIEEKIAGVTRVEAKLDALDEKFAAILGKVEEMDSKFDEKDAKEESAEIKTALDFVASQVISANENSLNNKAISQKIEVIEHQMTKFEKNIAKIISYLDED